MKNLHKPHFLNPLIAFLVLLTLVYTTSCSYYKAVQTRAVELSASGQNSSNMFKLFFLHYSDEVSHLMDVSILDGIITGTIAPETSVVSSSLPNPKALPKGRIKSEMKGATNEIHIYLKPSAEIGKDGYVEIHNQHIESIYVIEQDTGREILAVVGVVFGLLIVTTIIVLLTKSSCPYVYVFDGESYIFQGEIFSGAVLQNLERHDYMPLPNLKPANGKYFVRIANELKEHQFINLAELLVVNHPKGSKVLFDEDGNLLSIEQEVLPSRASSGKGIGQLQKLNLKDTLHFGFNESEIEKQYLELSFEKPVDAQHAKLILSGRNTEWGDYIFGEFAQMFGKRFDRRMQQQKKKSREERLQAVLQSEMPLSVYLKNAGKWELIDYFYMVGPLGEREMVMPIDLSDHSGKQIDIKLTTGFHFWNLNYAAMDFSQRQNFEVIKLAPEEIKPLNKHAQRDLLHDDRYYLEQKQVGDKVDLHFNSVKQSDGMEQTIFLHCKGYYEHVRQFKGKPDIVELKKFKQPGYFSKFSRAEYLKKAQEVESFVSNEN